MSTQFATRGGRETIAVPRARGLTLPFDLPLALAAIGLGVCSVLTIGRATADDIPGDPNFYVKRQLIYLAAGTVMHPLVGTSFEEPIAVRLQQLSDRELLSDDPSAAFLPVRAVSDAEVDEVAPAADDVDEVDDVDAVLDPDESVL